MKRQKETLVILINSIADATFTSFSQLCTKIMKKNFKQKKYGKSKTIIEN